jgi:hypothetical protein
MTWKTPQEKIRYFIVHLHRLLDPLTQTPPR